MTEDLESMSFEELEKVHEQLAEIGFECNLSQYHSKNQRKLMTPKLRREIAMRDGYTCQECGKYMPDGVGLHIDHIVPVFQGRENGAKQPSSTLFKVQRQKRQSRLDRSESVYSIDRSSSRADSLAPSFDPDVLAVHLYAVDRHGLIVRIGTGASDEQDSAAALGPVGCRHGYPRLGSHARRAVLFQDGSIDEPTAEDEVSHVVPQRPGGIEIGPEPEDLEAHEAALAQRAVAVSLLEDGNDHG